MIIIFNLSGQSKTSRKKMNERDEQAFGTPIDQSLSQDFDFEKNLALFNKKVWTFVKFLNKVLFLYILNI